TYHPVRSSSERRYVFERGGRPKGTPGSRPMSTIRPLKPSSRSVTAALPPASPLPTITNLCSRATRCPCRRREEFLRVFARHPVPNPIPRAQPILVLRLRHTTSERPHAR